MNKGQVQYLAYMLRLWAVDGDNHPVWRASLESPDSGERQAFRDLLSLFTFLEEQTGLPATRDDNTSDGGSLASDSCPGQA